MRNVGKLALAGVSFVALALPAQAQEQEAVPAAAPEATEGAADTGGIVVQARRRVETLQDVPAVVNAVTADDIQDLNLRELQDITTIVPGLTMAENPNGIGSTTTIRGVQFDVNASGDNGTVQYYYNDAPVSSGVVLQGLYDIGQIEVMRGPQGTLKGRASPSGAISITFRRPDLNEAGMYLQGTVNDIDGFNTNGAINVPIVDGKLGIRIAGLVSENDGNRVRPVRGGPDPYNDTEAGRFSVRADPLDGVFVVDFSYSTLKRDSRQYDQVQSVNQLDLTSDTPASPITIDARDRLAINSLPQDVTQKIQNYNLSASLNLFDQRLIYVGNWSKQRFTSLEPGDDAGIFTDTSGIQLTPTGDPLLPLTEIPFAQPTNSRSDSESHEIRLQNDAPVAGMFDYVVGFLNYQLDAPTNFQQVAGAVGNPGTGDIDGVILVPLQRFGTAEENSVFGNVTARIGDSLELSGGIRHIWYKTNNGVRSCGTDFVGCADIPSLARSLKDEATIYQLSAQYKFNRDLMVYASFGTSWRPDANFIGGPTDPTPEQDPFLSTPPEKSDNYEVGIKSSWFDGRLQVNLTGFYQEFKNYPYRVPGLSGTGVYSYDRARDQVSGFNYLAPVPVTVKGIEGDFSFRITDNWSISGVAAYADSKIDNGTIPCNDLNGDGTPDALLSPPSYDEVRDAYGAAGVATCDVNIRASSAPPFSATLTTEYVHPFNSGLEGVLRGLFAYKGSSKGDPTNAWDQVDDYGMLNLYAGLRDPDGAWEITAYAKNVTNTFRVLTRSNTRNFTPALGASGVTNLDYTNYYGITVTQPREFGLTARIAFGSR